MIFSKKNFFILKIKNHYNKKEKILSKISEHKFTPEHTISKTDWDNVNINWFDFSFSKQDKIQFLNFIRKKYNNNKKIIITQSWFNQYEPNSGSHHPLHNHEGTSLVGIYYVELMHNSLRTILTDPLNQKKIVPKIKEGDLLIFESKIFHESPKNFTNTRKTVVAFNFDLFE
jgi:hypothetical protein